MTAGSTSEAALGSSGAGALLSLATQEQMLGPSQPETDGMFERIASAEVPAWLREQVLQQIILTPRVVMDTGGSTFLSGELFDRGTVRSVENDRSDMPVVEGFAVESVLGILALRGIDLTQEELAIECSWILEQSDLFDRDLRDRGLGEVRALESGLAPFLRLVVGNLTDRDALLARLAEIDRRSSPISAAFREISETTLLAERAGCEQLLFPRRPPEGNGRWIDVIQNPAAALPAEPPQFVVLKLVTERLGRLPARSTLRETITVAETAAAEDLRELMAEWTATIESTPESTLRDIERRVARAVKTLDGASDASRVSKLVTIMGVPVAFAGALLSIPPEIGISVSLLGGFAEATSHAVKRHFRWASFGNN